MCLEQCQRTPDTLHPEKQDDVLHYLTSCHLIKLHAYADMKTDFFLFFFKARSLMCGCKRKTKNQSFPCKKPCKCSSAHPSFTPSHVIFRLVNWQKEIGVCMTADTSGKQRLSHRKTQAVKRPGRFYTFKATFPMHGSTSFLNAQCMTFH